MLSGPSSSTPLRNWIPLRLYAKSLRLQNGWTFLIIPSFSLVQVGFFTILVREFWFVSKWKLMKAKKE